MKNYKISALNRFLKHRGLPYVLANSSEEAPYCLLTIKNLPIYARLANTPRTLEKGLMGVARLDSNEGCLLDFGREVYSTLWMKNCKINLQAAMIDKSGKIIDILNMQYQNPNYQHHSSSPVRYALEMNEEFFTKNEIKVGDQFRLITSDL